MPKLYLDLETRSRLDLRKVGAERYAEDASTHVHCVCWAYEEGPVRLWVQGADLVDPDAVENMWLEWARSPAVTLVAHNAGFEKAVLASKFNLHVPPERWSDTAARCARLSISRKLEEAAPHLGLGEHKDTEGSRVMLKLARARKVSKENRDEFWNKATKPEDFERLYDYCRQDVVVMREIDKIVPELDEQESAVFRLTMKMNDRGVKVDTASIPLAEEVARHETHRLAERFKALTGHGPMSPRAPAALGLASLDKASVRAALKTCAPGSRLHEVLTLRKLVARSSVKKLAAFKQRTCSTGRIHGTLVYAGAERTLRWSGAGVQPQNFPRGMGEALLEAFQALQDGVFEVAYEDLLKTLADILRGFFVGPFLIGDFAQIEARVLAWLAGQADLIAVFAANGDPYSEMAGEIFGRTITKKSTDDSLPEGVTPRFIGKTVVLGAGYGLGAKKFREQLDTVYDVQIDEGFADRCIRAFRRKYSAIPALWKKLETGFAFAVSNNSKRIRVGPVFMGTTEISGRPFAFIEMPNGRRMFYGYPRVNEEGRVEYLGRNLYKGGAWETVSTYGGKIVENLVQALSRDLLASAMLRLDAAGFPLVLTVHDEVVSEAEDQSRLEEFEQILTEVPPWAAGLPLAVESFFSPRYRK